MIPDYGDVGVVVVVFLIGLRIGLIGRAVVVLAADHDERTQNASATAQNCRP